MDRDHFKGQSTDDQQNALRRLEAQRHKMSALFDSLPAEADEIGPLRERTLGHLSWLDEQIRRLAESIARRMAAATRFMGARAQLNEIGRNLLDAQAFEPGREADALDALISQQQIVDQLCLEGLPVEGLDEDQKMEAEELMKGFKSALNTIQQSRSELEAKMAEDQKTGQMQMKVSSINEQLSIIVNEV